MRSLKFVKMQGSGNDFIVIEGRQSPLGRPAHSPVTSRQLIKKLCDRTYGIGADGVLLLDKSKKADVRMRIFNADGSEAEMCGNGARCASLYVALKDKKSRLTLETKAGFLNAEVKSGSIKVRMTDPSDLRLGLTVRAAGKDHEVDYINTGVPHAVIAVDDLERVPVKEAGRAIRHHEVFRPAGTNVDFIEIKDQGHVCVRTYERGVEDETLACGTGSVASAIVASLNTGGESQSRPGARHKVFVKTRSGETLIVYFRASKKDISDVWLEGKAQIVFKGEYFIS